MLRDIVEATALEGDRVCLRLEDGMGVFRRDGSKDSGTAPCEIQPVSMTPDVT